jgi:outer membrane lipoprotein SlyB
MIRFALALIALLGVSACAPGNTGGASTAGAISGAERGTYGVIVSRRPIAGAEHPGAAGRDVRASILGAVGAAAGQGAEQAAFEFIVREDDGQTVSVVQTDEAGLRPGDRVLLSMGTRTRLSRAGE